MTEGWEDCRLLGPGWKRREVFRKSGQTCGKTDTYYLSPTGEKFRSRIEMMKYLGSSVDLTLFDYKNGTLLSPEDAQGLQKCNNGKMPRKRKQSDGSNSEVKVKIGKVPAPPDGLPTTAPDGTMIVCCEGCKSWFSGVLFGQRKVIRWFCVDCKAARRAYVKEQNFYKTVGCGTCGPCQLTEDCGLCMVCLLRVQDPQFSQSIKCTKRKCCKVAKKKSSLFLGHAKKTASKLKIKKSKLLKNKADKLKGNLPENNPIEVSPSECNSNQVCSPEANPPQVQGIQTKVIPALDKPLPIGLAHTGFPQIGTPHTGSAQATKQKATKLKGTKRKVTKPLAAKSKIAKARVFSLQVSKLPITTQQSPSIVPQLKKKKKIWLWCVPGMSCH